MRIIRGAKDSSPDEKDEAAQTFAALQGELAGIFDRQVMKYWIRPLKPHRLKDGALEFLAPDSAHQAYCAQLFQEHRFALAALAIRLVVLEYRSEVTEYARQAYHRECAPEELRNG